MFGVGRVKLFIKQRKWRKMNPHNESRMITNFRFDRVSVGKNTYAGLYVVDFSPKDTQLKIGSYCSIAGGVKFLLGGEHNTRMISTYPFKVKRFGEIYEAGSKGDIRVDDDVWIGESAIICSGVHIGQGAVIAAGAVVTRDVAPYTIVGGNPARLIRYRFEEGLRQKLMQVDIVRLFDSFDEDDLECMYSNLTEEKLDLMLNERGLYE